MKKTSCDYLEADRRNYKVTSKCKAFMELNRGDGPCNWLNSKERGYGQGQNRTAGTRIFSPLAVAGLYVTIGRYWYLFKRLTAVSAGRFYRFEFIDTDSSGKVVAKQRAISRPALFFFDNRTCISRQVQEPG